MFLADAFGRSLVSQSSRQKIPLSSPPTMSATRLLSQYRKASNSFFTFVAYITTVSTNDVEFGSSYQIVLAARYWDDPYSFKPERFHGDWPREAFLPFSAGARACLGRRWAISCTIYTGPDYTAGSLRPKGLPSSPCSCLVIRLS